MKDWLEYYDALPETDRFAVAAIRRLTELDEVRFIQYLYWKSNGSKLGDNSVCLCGRPMAKNRITGLFVGCCDDCITF